MGLAGSRASLDELSFQAQHCRALDAGTKSVEFFLEGVHCSACIWLIERVSRVAPAVLCSRFDLTRSVLQVTWNTPRAPLSAIARALDSLGYRPHPTSSTSLAEEQRKGDRALLLRLGIAGAAAGNVMLVALALYSGKCSGMASECLNFFRWGSLLIATPTGFWTGNAHGRHLFRLPRGVWPGERIAVDGVVAVGSSMIDTALLTGESLPQEVTVGEVWSMA